MAKLTLKLEEFGNTTEKVVENVEDLGDTISYFDEFLKGCGYVYDGQLQIIDCDRCYGRNDTRLSDEIQSIVNELYPEDVSDNKTGIYTLEDVKQMKFPFDE